MAKRAVIEATRRADEIFKALQVSALNCPWGPGIFRTKGLFEARKAAICFQAVL